ncbi:pyridoxamine 5'-phosphate oxidase [Achaetomium macrosporum]|uniref:Pyridoxamine 5'-phosphate oxidase n=1 Tax=Achaetomium macrosporum TaxID=79813 RepID=A0AAN7CES4_9PEZI|nr:pyridoxamine 5'-phosphate oxidase [Achaetomium macrosporum]
MEQQIPLSHEASAGNTNMRVTTSLPQEVVQCLENARFLHLATCSDNIPHVSLMNYTYLPSSPYSRSPVIVMTTNPASKKMNNLASNPNVSLLVHDWVSHRPTPTSQARRLSSDGSTSRSPNREPHSSLAALLFNLNTSAVSSISATINGSARLVERGSDEEKYYKDVHLENNTFDSTIDTGLFGLPGTGAGAESGVGEGESNAESRFAAGNEARVIVVGIRDVRIADWKGAVRDWVIAAPEESGESNAMMNRVR